ncbi:hypothetical protein VYU27_003752 [Nannochloropsis oceanica]
MSASTPSSPKIPPLRRLFSSPRGWRRAVSGNGTPCENWEDAVQPPPQNEEADANGGGGGEKEEEEEEEEEDVVVVKEGEEEEEEEQPQSRETDKEQRYGGGFLPFLLSPLVLFLPSKAMSADGTHPLSHSSRAPSPTPSSSSSSSSSSSYSYLGLDESPLIWSDDEEEEEKEEDKGEDWREEGRRRRRRRGKRRDDEIGKEGGKEDEEGREEMTSTALGWVVVSPFPPSDKGRGGEEGGRERREEDEEGASVVSFLTCMSEEEEQEGEGEVEEEVEKEVDKEGEEEGEEEEEEEEIIEEEVVVEEEEEGEEEEVVVVVEEEEEEEEEEKECIDRWGFVRKESAVDLREGSGGGSVGRREGGRPLSMKEEKARVQAREKEGKRAKKWLKMLRNWSKYKHLKPVKTKRRIRKGIPDAVRRQAWGLLLGLEEEMDSAPSLYAESCVVKEGEREGEEGRRDNVFETIER